MELLLSPQKASSHVGKTAYACQDYWDGLPFLTYAHRKDKTDLLHPILRRSMGIPGPYGSFVYSAVLYPTSQEELQSFYQTWLFFGLLAEFLGLNKTQNEDRVVDKATKTKIQALHGSMKHQEGDKQYLKVNWQTFRECREYFTNRVQSDMSNAEGYTTHLNSCLQLTFHMLQFIHCKPEFDESIRFSIAALGELFSRSIQLVTCTYNIEFTLLSMSLLWANGFMKPGSGAETRMLANGWCKSEIEKLRQQHLGLNTAHYLSWLSKPLPRRQHTECTIHHCTAFQLDPMGYRPAHQEKNCNCELIGIDMNMVTMILKTTDTFPVLQVKLADGPGTKAKISVIAYEPGIPYVALSHVRVRVFHS